MTCLGMGGDPVDVVGHLRVDSGISGVGAADSPRDDAALHVAVLKEKFGEIYLLFSMEEKHYHKENNLLLDEVIVLPGR